MKQKKTIRKQSSISSQIDNQIEMIENEQIHRSQTSVNLISFKLKRDTKAATSLFILVLIFFICWVSCEFCFKID
jgi:uncharacterized membrane protein